MTTGQLVFYSGFALLGLTVVTAIVFLIKKPRYVPGNAVYENAGTGAAQHLQNGYPTAQEAIRRDSSSAETELISIETEVVFSGAEKDSPASTEKTVL